MAVMKTLQTKAEEMPPASDYYVCHNRYVQDVRDARRMWVQPTPCETFAETDECEVGE